MATPDGRHYQERRVAVLQRPRFRHRGRQLAEGQPPLHSLHPVLGPGQAPAAAVGGAGEPGILRRSVSHPSRQERGGRYRPGPAGAGGHPLRRVWGPVQRPVHGQGPLPQTGRPGRGARPQGLRVFRRGGPGRHPGRGGDAGLPPVCQAGALRLLLWHQPGDGTCRADACGEGGLRP